MMASEEVSEAVSEDSDSAEGSMDAISDGISVISLSNESDKSDEYAEFNDLIQQFERITALHTKAIISCKSIEQQIMDCDTMYVHYMGKRYTFDEMLDELHETAEYNLEAGNTFGALVLGALEGAVFE
jgi:hypothetical protein